MLPNESNHAAMCGTEQRVARVRRALQFVPCSLFDYWPAQVVLKRSFLGIADGGVVTKTHYRRVREAIRKAERLSRRQARFDTRERTTGKPTLYNGRAPGDYDYETRKTKLFPWLESKLGI